MMDNEEMSTGSTTVSWLGHVVPARERTRPAVLDRKFGNNIKQRPGSFDGGAPKASASEEE